MPARISMRALRGWGGNGNYGVRQRPSALCWRGGGAHDLYDNPFSPYAFKVRAALYEKGIAHEQHEIRTHADREALLRVNPRGEVPALVDGGAVTPRSKVISPI